MAGLSQIIAMLIILLPLSIGEVQKVHAPAQGEETPSSRWHESPTECHFLNRGP